MIAAVAGGWLTWIVWAGSLLFLAWKLYRSFRDVRRAKAQAATEAAADVVAVEGLVAAARRAEAVMLQHVRQLVAERRAQLGGGELAIALSRRVWELYGGETFTKTLHQCGILHVNVVEDAWGGDPTKVELLLYVKGTVHTGHGIGETRPDCQGCQHDAAVAG